VLTTHTLIAERSIAVYQHAALFNLAESAAGHALGNLQPLILGYNRFDVLVQLAFGCVCIVA